MLFTKEEHRRKGCVKALVAGAIAHTRSLGLVPYVHVETDNVVSAKLFQGFQFEQDQFVIWFGF